MNTKRKKFSLEDQNESSHEHSVLYEATPGVEIPGTTWVSFDDIKNMPEVKLPIGFDVNQKKVLFTNQLGHYLVNGATGAGKTQLLCNMLSFLGQMAPAVKPHVIMIDKDGQTYETLKPFLTKQGYRVLRMNMSDPSHSVAFNPTKKLLRDYHTALKLKEELEKGKKKTKKDRSDLELRYVRCMEAVDIQIGAIVETIISTVGHKEPSWPEGARMMLIAIIWGALRDSEKPEITGLTEEYFTIENITSIALTTEDECGYIIQWLSRYEAEMPVIRQALGSYYKLAARQTRDSYVNSLCSPLGKFTTYTISRLTSNTSNTLDLGSIAASEEPVVLFLTPNDMNETANTLCTMLWSQVFSTFTNYAKAQPAKRLPRTLLCLLDEFCNIPPIPKLDFYITTLRSSGIFLTMFIQSLAQLQIVYGAEKAELLLDNCVYQAYLGSNNHETKAYFSKKFGQTSAKRKTRSCSGDGYMSINEQTVDVPLVKISDLDNLKLGEFYLYSSICANIHSYMLPYFMREDVDHTLCNDPEPILNPYTPPKPLYNIKEVLQRERKASAKTKRVSISDFSFDFP